MWEAIVKDMRNSTYIHMHSGDMGCYSAQVE